MSWVTSTWSTVYRAVGETPGLIGDLLAIFFFLSTIVLYRKRAEPKSLAWLSIWENKSPRVLSLVVINSGTKKILASEFDAPIIFKKPLMKITSAKLKNSSARRLDSEVELTIGWGQDELLSKRQDLDAFDWIQVELEVKYPLFYDAIYRMKMTAEVAGQTRGQVGSRSTYVDPPLPAMYCRVYGNTDLSPVFTGCRITGNLVLRCGGRWACRATGPNRRHG